MQIKRDQLKARLVEIGDMRPGSLVERFRKCGKPTCHCAKPDDGGHDPQFRLTRRVAGKTVTESFPNPAAWRKAQKEVAEFHRFQKLSAELVALNERICAQRPVEPARGGWTEQGKKRLRQSIKRWREK